MRALITAGGTAEPIDAVRVITNLSTGRFGAALANALHRRGVDVTLLASHALMAHPAWVAPGIRREAFGSFTDLATLLHTHAARSPDLLFMAAAVSDYSPVPHPGKLSSDAEELVIRLRRNPKLLPGLRERCGPETFLVGFKLLAGASRSNLVTAARHQIEAGRLDLTVANDMDTLRGGLHPVTLVEPGRPVVDHWGPKDHSAAYVADRALARSLDRSPGPYRGASSLLLHRPTRTVLLGRRRDGRWAPPGGRLEPGETPLGCARRELLEETGIDPPDQPPLTRVETAEGPWRIACFVHQVDRRMEPRPTRAMEARWVDLDRLDRFQPMVDGLAPVLERLRQILDPAPTIS